MSGENNYLNYDKLYNKVSQVITDEYLNNNNEDLFSRCPPPEDDDDLIKFQKLLKEAKISNKEKIKLYLCAVLSHNNNSDIKDKFTIVNGWISHSIDQTTDQTTDPTLKKLNEHYNDNIQNKYSDTVQNSKLIYFIQNCIL